MADSNKPSPLKQVTFLQWIAILVGSFLATLLLVAFTWTRYPDDNGKVGDAYQQTRALEQSCRNFISKFDRPPETLQELLKPPDGGRPYLESETCLIDSWGQPFQYDRTHINDKGKPDPLVFTVDPTTKKTIYAAGRNR